jgi:crotonobetainyl-CoA:carnitine CoA-transferase CaiB-like acyl-CoA transferase
MRRGSELLDHPQMQHCGAVIEIDDEQRGRIRQPGPIVRISENPAVIERSAPGLDEHREEFRSGQWTVRSDLVEDGSPHERALGDLTMLELGTFFAAPHGGTLLRELGARVIKVEPIEGEPMRGLLPFPEVGAAKSLQGKESIAIDLSTEEGRAIVHELARRSDVVLQSFRAGVAERRGVDAATLRTVNPDLVYLSAPGYGNDGPCGDRPAYAPTIGAGSGLVMRNIGSAVPERPGLSISEIRADARRLAAAGTTEYAQADGVSAVTVASAMALGIVARDRLGTGQTLLTTMLNSAAHTLADDMVEYAGRVPTPMADSDLYGLGARYRLYEASDGWIYLAAATEGEWDALTKALSGQVDLAADTRFVTEDLRRRHDPELADVLAATFRTGTAQHWEDTLLGEDVGCVVAHREPPESVLQSKDFAGASDLLVDVEHPTFGLHSRPKPFVEFSRSETVAEPGCLLGQHTDRILAELGYEEAAIADLRERKVVA